MKTKKQKLMMACTLFSCMATMQAQSNAVNHETDIFTAMDTEMQIGKETIMQRLGTEPFFLEFTASQARNSFVLAQHNQLEYKEGNNSNTCKATITLTGDMVARENEAHVASHYDFKDGGNWASLREGLHASILNSLESVVSVKNNSQQNTSGTRFVSMPPVTHIEASAFSTSVPIESMKSTCMKIMKGIAKYHALHDDTLCITSHRADLYRLTSEEQKTRSSECYYIVDYITHSKNAHDKDTRFYFSKAYGEKQLTEQTSEIEKDILQYALNVTETCRAKDIEKDFSYEGPVLFEDDAAWTAIFKERFWYYQLTSNNVSYKYPVGKSICHQLVSIVQNNNMDKTMCHTTDADGIATNNILLVSNGIIKNKIGGRIIFDSNVSPSGNYIYSSLIMTPQTRYRSLHATSSKTKPAAEIRQEFIKEAKTMGLSHAYIIKKHGSLSLIAEVDVTTGKEQILNASISVKDLQTNENDEFSSEEHTITSLYGGNLSACTFPQCVLLRNISISIEKPATQLYMPIHSDHKN